MDWFFDGLGTFLLGLLLGSGAGSFVSWRLTLRSVRQSQRARDNASQVQIGRNQNINKKKQP